MKAKDIMTTRVVTVGPGHNVRHAAQIMLDQNVSGLPVISDEGHVVGLITEGDLLLRTELNTQSFLESYRSPARVRQQARLRQRP